MLMNRFLFSLIGIAFVIPALFGVKPAGAPTNLTRGGQADAERWMAMGTYYQKLQSAAALNANLNRIQETDAARWTAMGQTYAIQRDWNADAARWAAMGQAYAGSAQRGWKADAARWTAMGDYYVKLKAESVHK